MGTRQLSHHARTDSVGSCHHGGTLRDILCRQWLVPASAAAAWLPERGRGPGRAGPHWRQALPPPPSDQGARAASAHGPVQRGPGVGPSAWGDGRVPSPHGRMRVPHPTSAPLSSQRHTRPSDVTPPEHASSLLHHTHPFYTTPHSNVTPTLLMSHPRAHLTPPMSHPRL